MLLAAILVCWAGNERISGRDRLSILIFCLELGKIRKSCSELDLVMAGAWQRA